MQSSIDSVASFGLNSSTVDGFTWAEGNLETRSQLDRLWTKNLAVLRLPNGFQRRLERWSEVCLSAPGIYTFDSQQRSNFACADSKAKMGPIPKAT
jgi:hypothetical protein